jgi:ssRNA-specific RNase YbeY (16S rRNA maturation enzyme)
VARPGDGPLRIDIAWCLRKSWRAVSLLNRVAEYTTRAEGFLTGELSVAVVGARAMRQLHHRFLGVAEITDVLAFDFATAQRRRHLDGEVVLCADLARRRCPRRQRWLPAARAELALYLVHGGLRRPHTSPSRPHARPHRSAPDRGGFGADLLS